MNARVHAVLAAGVRSPNLIVEWQENPQFLLDQGIEPAAFDLARSGNSPAWQSRCGITGWQGLSVHVSADEVCRTGSRSLRFVRHETASRGRLYP